MREMFINFIYEPNNKISIPYFFQFIYIRLDPQGNVKVFCGPS
jgi:hypothetical protein